jgi:serine/threonine-protein kinase RsbT
MDSVIEAFRHAIRHEIDIYVTASSGRGLAVELGFNKADSTRVEIAILELARNIVVHAGSGEILVQPIERNGLPGVEIIASDQGPGIKDPALALQDGYSTASTMGAGLPGVRRLMDEFELETGAWGTRVRAARWHRPAARRLP